MANVCRPLQNGLPALRFAVIRRAFGALLLELGSEPARVVFAPALFFVLLINGSEDACSRLLGLFLFGPSPRLPLTQVRDGAVQPGRHRLARVINSTARLLGCHPAAGASCAA